MRGSEFAGRKAWWQGLRRKVRCKALQQANLRRQDKKDAPKAGDGNLKYPKMLCHNACKHKKDAPKAGDGNSNPLDAFTTGLI